MIERLLKKHALFLQVGVVGAIGAVIQMALLFVLVQFFLVHPVIGNLLAAEVAIVCNFIINNLWTFKNRSMHALPKRFLMFNTSVLGSLVIQTVVVWLGVHTFGHGLYLAYAVIGIGIGWVFNYTMYTRFVWKHHPVEELGI